MLARLRELHAAGDHAAAAANAQAALADYPEHRDLLLIAARAQRHLGRIDAALALLDRLAARHPGFSLEHQERGLCHVARKDAPAAIASLTRATRINPALPMAWRMLDGVYRLTGDTANAARAAAQSRALAALPGEVVRATALFSDGDLDPAEAMIRTFLLRHGDHPEAMRLLARIGMARLVWDDAEILLAGVLAMVPDYAAARLDYARTLSERHKPAEARDALAPLLAAEPGNRDYRVLATAIAVGLGNHDEAIALYRDLLGELPEDGPPEDGLPEDALPEDAGAVAAMRADLNLWLGHALKTVGALDPAIAAYRAAIAARPRFGDAWWSLANLKTYRFAEAEIAAMIAAEADPATALVDRIHLAFALGKAREDRGDVDGAWAAYARGNAAHRAESAYRPDVFETNTAEQKRICTAGFLAGRTGWGCPAPDPIFITGLPRSGSTLIEQILASHPLVEGTQELPQIQRIALELQGRDPDLDHPRYPGALVDLSASQIRALGERYLAETRIHRQTDRPFFIDKMPNNFRHIGLIRLILPQAKIIDARREPMACCFSNLKQLFAQGQEFAYSPQDIARYYRTYLDLMRHWQAAGADVLRVLHEEIIEDLEGNVRRLLDHCGLAFDPACLAFHETRRSIRTPSSEQVRRPIFRDGLDQWRAFQPHLAPLQAALGDALEHWRS